MLFYHDFKAVGFISGTYKVVKGAGWGRGLLMEEHDDGALGAAGVGAAVGCSVLGHDGLAGRAFLVDHPSGCSHEYTLPLLAWLWRARGTSMLTLRKYLF